MSTENNRPAIQYSCYFSRSRAGEQFVPEHAVSYILSGNIEINDGTSNYAFKEGDLYFCRRNSLAKFTKLTGAGGEFRSISIFFDQDVLRSFALEYNYGPGKNLRPPSFLPIATDSVLGSYMESLKAYEDAFKGPGAENLLAVKRKEALLLLLQTRPELKDVLFDLSEPGKIDIEAFMQQHYHFNVEIKKFAYLTGRSLSTFKRDFEKVFHETPSRWLVSKRLQEAYHLIKDKGKIASDIYLDLGFEDLSHFSFAFKKQYGVAPSLLTA